MIDLRSARRLLAALLFVLPPQLGAEIKPEPVLRTEGPFAHTRLNKNHKYMAFTDHRGQSLRILDVESQDVVEVTKHRVGPSFFWSPDGGRLFYRELIREGEGKSVISELKAYEVTTAKTLPIETLAGSSGYLTLDPRDYQMLLMHEKGTLSKRLEFPGERLARWQKRQRPDEGRWIASQKAILWLSDLGLTLSTLKDDTSGVASFDISPDGKTMAWATEDARIFVSTLGEKARFLGRGKDPRWHPHRALLLYSGAREIGNKVYDTDVRIADLSGKGRFLTATAGESERWPQWWDDNTILFTREGSTDLWRIPLREEPTAKATDHKGTSVE